MENKKQTAVEWMFDKLLEEGSNGTLRWHLKYDIFKIFEEAKEMEKEQIEESFKHGRLPIMLGSFQAKDYYKQTYGEE
jgi:hypothetical protein